MTKYVWIVTSPDGRELFFGAGQKAEHQARGVAERFNASLPWHDTKNRAKVTMVVSSLVGETKEK